MNRHIENLKNSFRLSSLGRTKWYLALRYFVKRKQMDGVIDKYIGKDITPARRKELKSKMRGAMINYRWDFDEFFIFHFEESDEKQRKSYATEYDKNIFADTVNDPEQVKLLQDKWTTYQHFKELYGRDLYNIRSLTDLQTPEFVTFIQKHPSYIIKPVFGTRGAGVEIHHSTSVDDAINKLSSLYISGVTAIVIEELIQQDEKLAVLHPESANTLRVITICYPDRVDVIHAYLRMGKGKAVIDNASAGGVFGVINVNTGKIYAACDRWGNSFTKHPDSGVNIIGFEIPRWEEVKVLAQKAARMIPKVHYVGWDIAVTTTGCVLIEGNEKGRWSFQFAKQEGFRDEMNAILRELGKKEIR